ncbi:MAG: hypothetical protein ACLQVI_37285 [Polyangiaceae bacterium]
MKVTLVSDPTIGDGLEFVEQPLWVADSPANRPVVERLWSRPGRDPTGVTLITALGPTPEATCIETLPAIDEHHPRWTELVVIGVVATARVRDAFAPYGPGAFVDSPGGFAFMRTLLERLDRDAR